MSTTNNNPREKISLENFNFNSKSQRLSSPFSIKACLLKGVKEEDLYKLTLEEYISTHPESKDLPKEIQTERFDNYEQNHNELIELLKETRNKLKEKSEKLAQLQKDKQEKKDIPNEEEPNMDEKNNNEIVTDKNGMTIKSKNNIKRYKKLKDDMELTIKLQIE